VRRSVTAVAALSLCVVLLAVFLLVQFAPALSLSFAGDDFELLSLARISGLRGAAIASPRRGLFVKPVMSATWALLVRLFGAHPAPWFAVCLATHLTNAALLGLLARQLAKSWSRGRAVEPGTAAWMGLGTVAIWAVHDRLSEPVYSISAWNHSLAFAFYLAALLSLLRALQRGSRAGLLQFAFFSLLGLLTYEVDLSLLPVSALLVLLHPSPASRLASLPVPPHPLPSEWGWGRRLAFAGPYLAGVAALYGAVRLAILLNSPWKSYDFVSPAVAPRNISEIFLAFFHLRCGSIAPPVLAGATLAGSLAVCFILIKDPAARFGLGWFAAASLMVSVIPEYSDRYHYIPFAGLALTAGCLLRGSLLPRCVFACTLVAHLIVSFGGSREQVTWYALKGSLHSRLLEQVRDGFDRSAQDVGAGAARASGGEGHAGPLIAVVWDAGPGGSARLEAAAASVPRRFGDPLYPLYLRPKAVAQLVYAADLLNVARAEQGEFYRTPEPARAAQAIADRALQIIPIEEARQEPPARLLSDIRNGLLSRHEVPVALGPMRIAYLEPTDRMGAFASEYGLH